MAARPIESLPLSKMECTEPGTAFQGEKHLIVFWRSTPELMENVIAQVGARFELHRVIRLHWSKEKVGDNFAHFFASKESLPGSPDQVVLPLFVIVFSDLAPRYSYRRLQDSKLSRININCYELAQALGRQKNLSCHISYTPKEFRQAYLSLFGAPPSDVRSLWPGQIEDVHRDVMGTEGWKDLDQVFGFLNEIIDYVVITDLEPLPAHYAGGDIGLIVDTPDACERARFVLDPNNEKQRKKKIKTVICGVSYAFDIRSLEDFYIDPRWAQDILKHKIKIRCFYAPRLEDQFFLLLYKAYILKPRFPAYYLPQLINMACEIGLNVSERSLSKPHRAAKLIGDFLNSNAYCVTQPLGRYYNARFVVKMGRIPIQLPPLYKASVLAQNELASRVNDLALEGFQQAILERDAGNVERAVGLLLQANELLSPGKLRTSLCGELDRLIQSLEQTWADAIKRLAEVHMDNDHRRRAQVIAKAILSGAIETRDSGNVAGAMTLLLRGRDLDPISGEIQDGLSDLSQKIHSIQYGLSDLSQKIHSPWWLLGMFVRRMAAASGLQAAMAKLRS